MQETKDSLNKEDAMSWWMQTDLYQSLYKEMENTVCKFGKQVDMFSACNRVFVVVVVCWFFFFFWWHIWIQYCTVFSHNCYCLMHRSSNHKMLCINVWESYIWDGWKWSVWFSFILWLFSTSLTFSESAMFKFLIAYPYWCKAEGFLDAWSLKHNHFIILWEMHIAHHIEV